MPVNREPVALPYGLCRLRPAPLHSLPTPPCTCCNATGHSPGFLLPCPACQFCSQKDQNDSRQPTQAASRTHLVEGTCWCEFCRRVPGRRLPHSHHACKDRAFPNSYVYLTSVHVLRWGSHCYPLRPSRAVGHGPLCPAQLSAYLHSITLYNHTRLSPFPYPRTIPQCSDGPSTAQLVHTTTGPRRPQWRAASSFLEHKHQNKKLIERLPGIVM